MDIIDLLLENIKEQELEGLVELVRIYDNIILNGFCIEIRVLSNYETVVMSILNHSNGYINIPFSLNDRTNPFFGRVISELSEEEVIVYVKYAIKRAITIANSSLDELLLTFC